MGDIEIAIVILLIIIIVGYVAYKYYPTTALGVWVNNFITTGSSESMYGNVTCTAPLRSDFILTHPGGKYKDIFGQLTQTGQTRMAAVKACGPLPCTKGVYADRETFQCNGSIGYNYAPQTGQSRPAHRNTAPMKKGGPTGADRRKKSQSSKAGTVDNMHKAEMMTPSVDDPDHDYMHEIAVQNVNPAILKNHRAFVADRQIYARQPAAPDDRIETNYINYTGFARRNLPPVRSDARQVPGIDPCDYAMPWASEFG